MVHGKDQAHSFGQMELAMKVNGATTKQTELANFGMLTVMFMKVSGRMIKQMDTEFTFTSMVLDTKAIGKMIYKMVRVLNRGVMDLNIKEGTKKE